MAAPSMTAPMSAPVAPPMSGADLAFVQALIGGRWELGAEGADAWDCWSLVRHVQARLFGRDLPRIAPDAAGLLAYARAMRDAPERRRWTPVERPAHGDLVELIHVRHPLHIGCWIEPAPGQGTVLHCAEYGVAVEEPWRLQALGWRDFRYLTWAGHMA